MPTSKLILIEGLNLSQPNPMTQARMESNFLSVTEPVTVMEGPRETADLFF